jgi:hypothetical protein
MTRACFAPTRLYDSESRLAAYAPREVTKRGLTKTMSGKPAKIRQRDAKQILEAAKKAGAKNAQFRMGDVSVIINLADQKVVESDEPITL